jgi:hypothetical protein
LRTRPASQAIIRRCRDIGAQKSKAGSSFSRLCWLTGPASVKNALLPADWGGELAEIEGRFGE